MEQHVGYQFPVWRRPVHDRGRAYGDAEVSGELKRGGGPQVAPWPVLVSFTTTSAVVEVVFRAEIDSVPLMFSVNGRMVSDMNVNRTASGMYFTATLTFPTVRCRIIRVLCGRELGFISVRLPTGATLSKSAESIKRRVEVLGDSDVNGAGGPASAGADLLETFALRLTRPRGADDQVLAGISGMGWVSGANATVPAHYTSRRDAVLAMNPHVLAFYGSLNDGPSGTGVQAALARCTAVPELYVVGPLLNGNHGNSAAVEAGTQTAGRVFIDLGRYPYGSGKLATPKGDGNRDFYLLSDGIHPTFTAQKTIAERILRGICTRTA